MNNYTSDFRLEVGVKSACPAGELYAQRMQAGKVAEQVVMIQCHGRTFDKLVGADKVMQFDALPLYMKYTDVFLMDDVPEAERNPAARQAAEAIIHILRREGLVEPHVA